MRINEKRQIMKELFARCQNRPKSPCGRENLLTALKRCVLLLREWNLTRIGLPQNF